MLKKIIEPDVAHFVPLFVLYYIDDRRTLYPDEK